MPINYQKTYDDLSYEEGVEFRDLTMKVIRELYPYYVVTPAEPQNPWHIYITNQDDNVRLSCPLRDIYSRFAQTARTETDLKDVILNDFSSAIKIVDELDPDEEAAEESWSEVCDRVQPRLTRIEDLPGEPETLAANPFGEGVVTAFAIFDKEKQMHTWIRKEMLEKWKIPFDELFKKATENLENESEGMEFVGTAKPRAYLRNEKGVEYAATTILLGGVRYLIAQTIGSPYRFGIPSSFVFYSWTEFEDEEFQLEMRAMMQREHDRLPGRLSTNIYEVDENGQIKQLKDLPEIPKPPMFSNN